MAELKNTIVNGILNVNGNLIASTIIKRGGTSSQILMADGSTSTISELITVPNISVSDTTSATTHPIVGDITSSGHTITVTRKSLADLGLSTVYKYKGTKTWAQLLAVTSAAVGDVYSITDKDPEGNTNADWACYTKVTAATGNNYATYWQSLGGKVDLSAYVQGSGTAKKIPVFTNASTLGDSAIAMTNQDTVKIDTSGHTSLTDPALHIHHYGPQTGDDYAEMMILSGLTRSPYGLRFRSHGSGTQIIQSQRIADNSECFGLSLNPNGGNVAIGKQTASYKLDVNGSIGASGFIHSGITVPEGNTRNDYVLLAGGGTKPLSEFQGSGNFVTIDTTQTITGAKTFSEKLTVTNSSTPSTIKGVDKSGCAGSCAVNITGATYFNGPIIATGGIYMDEGGTTEDTSPDYLLGVTSYGNEGKIYYTRKAYVSVGDSDKLDGKHGSYYLDYDNFTNTPTIPDPIDYYWANVNVSTSSSTATAPSVQKIGITGSTTTTAAAAVTMEYDSSYKALKFVFA